MGSDDVSNLIKLQVGSSNIGRTFSSFQRCEDTLKHKVGDVEGTGVMRAERGWFVDNRGRCRFSWESSEELVIGGDGGGGAGHDEEEEVL